MVDYKSKYLKYKLKYINLIGGNNTTEAKETNKIVLAQYEEAANEPRYVSHNNTDIKPPVSPSTKRMKVKKLDKQIEELWKKEEEFHQSGDEENRKKASEEAIKLLTEKKNLMR